MVSFVYVLRGLQETETDVEEADGGGDDAGLDSSNEESKVDLSDGGQMKNN